MQKGPVQIGNKRYQLESWVSYDFDREEFILAFQFYNSSGEVQPMRWRVPREFVDDEIKNNATTDDLEPVYRKMLEQRIDVINEGKASDAQLRRWLKQAAKDLQQST